MIETFRWWRHTRLRTAKKHVNRNGFWQDGTFYPWEEYEILLTLVARLQPGAPIWNSFAQGPDSVKEVRFDWRPLTGKPRGDEGHCRAIKGEVIDQFVIKSAAGFFVYDLEWLQHWNPIDPTPEQRRKMNQAIGIDPGIESWPQLLEWWRRCLRA